MSSKGMMGRAIALWFLSCLACASFVASAQTAHAQAAVASVGAPAQCLVRPALLAKYNLGQSAGQQKADAWFASAEIAKNPKKLQAKLGRVFERLHGHVRDAMQQEAREGRRCRVQGVADSFMQRIAQLLGQCIFDGAQWGQFAAQLYCELSVELGGLAEPSPFMRVPAGLCGTLFEQTCDGVYAYVASEGEVCLAPSVQQFVNARGLLLSTYPGCAEFTEGSYEAVFEAAVQTDCAYGVP